MLPDAGRDSGITDHQIGTRNLQIDGGLTLGFGQGVEKLARLAFAASPEWDSTVIMKLCIFVVLLGIPNCLEGCLWDRDTLAEERTTSPDLAEAALHDKGTGRNLHLAMAAFEKAIQLGSLQDGLLRAHIKQIKTHIGRAGVSDSTIIVRLATILVTILFGVGALIFLRSRKPTVPKTKVKQ